MPGLRGNSHTSSAKSTEADSNLVGRAGEMQRLTAALTRAAKSRGGTIFLTGEAGIGKTRLAQEALVIAQARDFGVLQSRAYSVEGDLAYAPFTGTFGPFLRALDPPRRLSLTGGLPDLGRLFGGLRFPPPESLGDPALEKTRLFESVACLVERLAQQSPLVLFLDDLQWADAASLELFHYVARSMAGQRAVLLATCTTPQLDLTRGLRIMIQSLQRAGLAEEIKVSRLGPEEVAAIARERLGGDPPGALLEMLNARSGGTPLYVEALVRALVEGGQLIRGVNGWELSPGAGQALPASVRELVRQRLERLEEQERTVLNLIAVADGPAPYDLLAVGSGVHGAALERALERLLTLGLVGEEMTGSEVTYRFTHPLVQEVAYADLSEITRRHLHAAVIEVLEVTRPDPAVMNGQALSRLAHHYRGAGTDVDQSRALEVFLAAGGRARETYANDEAARYLAAALALVRSDLSVKDPRSETADIGRQLPQLLESLGDVWERAGELGSAVAAWTEALAEYKRRNEVFAIARLCRPLALAEWDRGHLDAARAFLESGLTALAEEGPSSELLGLYLAKITICNRVGDISQAASTADAALAMAKQLTSPRAEAEARIAESNVCLSSWDFIAAREQASIALSVAESAANLSLAHGALDRMTLATLLLGEHRYGRQLAERALDLARRLGGVTIELLPRFWMCWVHFFAGNWDEEVRRVGEGLALARRVGHTRAVTYFLGLRGLTMALRGDLAGAEACVAEARATYGHTSDRHVLVFLPIIELLLALERGQPMPALAAISSLDQDGRLSLTAMVPPPGAAFWPTLVSEAYVAAGQPERAMEIVRQLKALGSYSEDEANRFEARQISYASALAARVEGLARLGAGERSAALACLTRAIEGLEVLELPFEAARARLDWATAAVAADGTLREAVVAAALESLTVFERIGAQRYARRARQLCHKLGAHPRTVRGPVLTGATLSPRELEVSRLVVEGLTAPSIGERLCISPHTATAHIRRIYSRLGINSRPALARYMVEHDLADAKS
ncbi:MAG: AAA family ATPase [Chloroflexi bacterium]|nr:AAA family ATPase [Chloroflexota bacterium]